MSIYSELPVYKSTYLLLHHLVQMSPSWQRDYRYTLGADLKNELMDLIILIYRANSTDAKSAVIGEGRECIERVKVYIRLLHDLRQIGDRQYSALTEETGSISKQLARWQAKSEDSNQVRRPH